jgi:site-specific recombinase XerD
MKEFHQHLIARGLAESTIRKRIGDLDRLSRRVAIWSATAEQLEEVLAEQRECAPETRKGMLSSWRVFYQWARRTGRIESDPTEELSPIPIPRRIPRIADDETVQLALIGAPVDETAMVLLARFGCLRLSEVTNLPRRAREGRRLRIIGKGDKERMIVLNDTLFAALTALERELGETTYYFPGRYGGALHPQSVHKIIKRRTGQNPHSLRHAGATAAYNRTHDLRGVQEMLGHASMATTQRYLHLDDEAMQRIAEATAWTSTVRSPHFRSTLSSVA